MWNLNNIFLNNVKKQTRKKSDKSYGRVKNILNKNFITFILLRLILLNLFYKLQKSIATFYHSWEVWDEHMPEV